MPCHIAEENSSQDEIISPARRRDDGGVFAL
jgi:hypothetical protein